MKTFAQFAVFLFLFVSTSYAQQVSSKIMDARIDWSPSGSQYSGQVSVYLTDTIGGIAGVKISIGSQPGDSDIYQANQTIDSNGNLSGQGTLYDNVLQTSIGTFSYHANYYAKLSILLNNGQSNQIAIHSSN